MLVSIFIPTYNGRTLLPRTLESVLAQTYTDWELVVVDDSSTDGTYQLLKDYAERDARIRLFQKPNEGDVPHAWRFALPRLQGEWVLYMSQDDRLEPDTVQLLVERQVQTQADAVLTHEVHYLEGRPIDGMFQLHGVGGDTAPVLTGKETFRLMVDYSISGRALWRTSIVRQVGIRTDVFDADELAQREWALHCNKVAFSDAMFYYCRGNDDSITEHHSPLHYDSCLTNSLLLLLAEEALPADDPMLRAMANAYFDHMLYMTILYFQRRRTYTKHQRQREWHAFREAYGILQGRCGLRSRKHRIALRCWTAFVDYTYVKAMVQSLRGYRLEDNYDVKIKPYLE